MTSLDRGGSKYMLCIKRLCPMNWVLGLAKIVLCVDCLHFYV
jgi:hypothetical protein